MKFQGLQKITGNFKDYKKLQEITSMKFQGLQKISRTTKNYRKI